MRFPVILWRALARAQNLMQLRKILRKRKALRRMTALLTILLLAPLPAHAGLIRDAEIENTLRSYADPIFKAAGLKPSAINIYIVQDDSLNAFVAGGSNLFLHTGMIMATKNADMLLGVIAHETGHISGGHLAKGTEKLKNAQINTLLTYVLGGAAAVATGKPEAAAAVITGGSSSIARNVMSFSRANENAADQAGVNFLAKTNTSAEGMLEVFELLKKQEMQHYGKSDPYLRTHPLTNERIEFIRNSVAKSSIPAGAYPKNFTEKHARMVAKLFSFLEPPEKTFRTYPTTDNSTAASMARAIAYYKLPDIDKAMNEMNALLKTHPNDAYLYDLKGQILFESARIEEAKAAYAKAAELAPREPLILSDLAKTELALNTPQNTQSEIGRAHV